jgi:hypothetical protein
MKMDLTETGGGTYLGVVFEWGVTYQRLWDLVSTAIKRTA